MADKFTVEDAKSFILDHADCAENWLKQADASWGEIKKLQKNGKMWSVMPNSARKRVRYPLWNSITKIRKPIVYSRTPTPIGIDSTEAKSPVCGTAAICLERLAKAIMRTFAFDEVIEAARDDRLVTDFGAVRAYYEKEDVKERVKIRVAPIVNQETGETSYIDEDGDPVEEEILVDDVGPYVETERIVDVTNERVYLKPVLYRNFGVDPSAYRWDDVRTLYFAEDYSKKEFKRIFGSAELQKIPSESFRTWGKSKRTYIRVYEIWDWYTKKCYWLPEGGSEFIKPKDSSDYEDTEQGQQNEAQELNGLYDLQRFFPCPKPMVGNAPTDSFWPVTEWYQLCDLFEEIHTLASRIFILTRAIRIRGLFDSSVQELQSLINEVTEADWIGVPNLVQTLTGVGGDIRRMVAYLPIEEMVAGLNNMYQALQNRLETVYRLTGTSDLLQGTTDTTERTYGEQQMKAKYAMNQIEPIQKGMQDFVRDGIELLCEMALKNFSDDSLAQYIVPEGLDQEDQQRYPQAINLLKNDRKRQFRIELETDSTIALNESYEKAARVEMVNALTGALNATASVIKESPMLAPPLIQMLKHLAAGFRQGKMFQDEIKTSLDSIIEQVSQPPPPPQPDPSIQIAQMNIQSQEKIVGAQLQAQQALEMAKLNSATQLKMADVFEKRNQAMLTDRFNQLKLQVESVQANKELITDIQKAIQDIAVSREELAIWREQILLDAQSEQGAQALEQFKALQEVEQKKFDASLAMAQQTLEEWKAQLEMRERYITEARLQREEQEELALAQREEMRNAELQTMEALAASVPKVVKTETVENDPLTGATKITSKQEAPIGPAF